MVLAVLFFAVAARAQPCPSDCDGNGSVSVDELLVGIRVGLEIVGKESCPAADANGDERVSIDELVAGTGSVLRGCPGITTLAAAVDPEDDVIALADVNGLPPSGVVRIDRELVAYAGVSIESFDPMDGAGGGATAIPGILTGVERGFGGTEPAAHDRGAGVQLVAAFTPTVTPTPETPGASTSTPALGTATVAPSATPATSTPVASVSPTASVTHTRTPSQTTAPTTTGTLTITHTPILTRSPTDSSTATRTASFTSTRTGTRTATPSGTPTRTDTATRTRTGTFTLPTATRTATPSRTRTPTRTAPAVSPSPSTHQVEILGISCRYLDRRVCGGQGGLSQIIEVTARATAPEGSSIGWHTEPRTVIGCNTSDDLCDETEDCVTCSQWTGTGGPFCPDGNLRRATGDPATTVCMMKRGFPGGEGFEGNVFIGETPVEVFLSDGSGTRALESGSVDCPQPNPLPPSCDVAFLDNGDGTITEITSGLMWEKKAALDGVRNPSSLHDADNLYAWAGRCTAGQQLCQPSVEASAACVAQTGNSSGCAVCPAGECSVGPVAAGTIWQWLVDLNQSGFAGYSDWRIPYYSSMDFSRRAELGSFFNRGAAGPPYVAARFHTPQCGMGCGAILDPACSCTASVGGYWSATTAADDAFVVFFGTTGVLSPAVNKPLLNLVRAIREVGSCPPAQVAGLWSLTLSPPVVATADLLVEQNGSRLDASGTFVSMIFGACDGDGEICTSDAGCAGNNCVFSFDVAGSGSVHCDSFQATVEVAFAGGLTGSLSGTVDGDCASGTYSVLGLIGSWQGCRASPGQ